MVTGSVSLILPLMRSSKVVPAFSPSPFTLMSEPPIPPLNRLRSKRPNTGTFARPATSFSTSYDAITRPTESRLYWRNRMMVCSESVDMRSIIRSKGMPTVLSTTKDLFSDARLNSVFCARRMSALLSPATSITCVVRGNSFNARLSVPVTSNSANMLTNRREPASAGFGACAWIVTTGACGAICAPSVNSHASAGC